MNYNIVAQVHANGHDGWIVLDKPPKMEYTKYGHDTIIGTDGLFYTFYGYDRPSKGFYAFAGREFEIKLSDGTVEHCYGQWWDKITDTAREVLNLKNDKLIHIASSTVEDLKRCYVFYGHSALKSKFYELVSRYSGKIYGYWEYEAIINGRDKPMKEDV